MSSAKKARGRRLLEQRLLSYRRNPSYFDAAPDAVSAVQRVEDHLRQLDELAIATDVDLPEPNRDTGPSTSPKSGAHRRRKSERVCSRPRGPGTRM